MLTPDDGRVHAEAIVDAHREPRWLTIYMRWAGWCLRHRWVTMVAAAAFFVGSIMLIPLLPTGFVPPDDNSQTQVYLELAPGSTLADTKAAAEQARQLVMTVPHVKSVYTTIGGGAGRPIRSRRRACRGAQGDAHDPAHRTRATAGRKRPIEANIRKALRTVAPRRAKQGGAGGSGEVHPGAHR